MTNPLRENAGWRDFAQAVKGEFVRCGFQKELIAACGGAEDIAWAAFFHHGAASLKWLEGEVPFLNNARPRDLIQRGRSDRVRECLWRTP